MLGHIRVAASTTIFPRRSQTSPNVSECTNPVAQSSGSTFLRVRFRRKRHSDKTRSACMSVSAAPERRYSVA